MINFVIKGTNTEITLPLKEYVEKKLQHVEKYLNAKNTQVVMYVELAKTTNHHKNGEIYCAEVHFRIGKRVVYVVSEKGDMYEAIDGVEEKVIEEIKENNGKARALFKRGSQKIKELIKNISPFSE